MKELQQQHHTIASPNRLFDEQRRHYRKRIRSPGYLAGMDDEVEFTVRDLSVKGFLAKFSKAPGLQLGQSVYFRLPEFNLKGEAVARWIAPTSEGGCRIGFEFSRTRPEG